MNRNFYSHSPRGLYIANIKKKKKILFSSVSDPIPECGLCIADPIFNLMNHNPDPNAKKSSIFNPDPQHCHKVGNY